MVADEGWPVPEPGNIPAAPGSRGEAQPLMMLDMSFYSAAPYQDDQCMGREGLMSVIVAGTWTSSCCC